MGGTGQALSLLLDCRLLPWLDALPRKHVGCTSVICVRASELLKTRISEFRNIVLVPE